MRRTRSRQELVRLIILAVPQMGGLRENVQSKIGTLPKPVKTPVRMKGTEMKVSLLLLILLLIFANLLHAGMPAPPEADLPKISNIFVEDGSVWFYSDLEVQGFSLRHVIEE